MTSGKIDLHVHTTASDGTLTPRETVAEAVRQGLALLGVTDHDTTDGIAEAEAAARDADLSFVAGVELSVGSGEREIHVLGYFIAPAHERLQEVLERVRTARDIRNERIVARLRELGVPVDLQRVQEIAGDGSVGRPHIAAALMEAGHVPSQHLAFKRYLARGKPAYVNRERLGPAEAVALIREAGGVPVLAHPAKIGPREAIEELIDLGMEGVEVYHIDHDEGDRSLLMQIAQERGLLITGGTDSHGPHSDRPIPIGGVTIPEWVGEQVLRRAPARGDARA